MFFGINEYKMRNKKLVLYSLNPNKLPFYFVPNNIMIYKEYFF